MPPCADPRKQEDLYGELWSFQKLQCKAKECDDHLDMLKNKYGEPIVAACIDKLENGLFVARALPSADEELSVDLYHSVCVYLQVRENMKTRAKRLRYLEEKHGRAAMVACQRQVADNFADAQKAKECVAAQQRALAAAASKAA